LLQHADTPQAKPRPEPASPNRAAVMAWRGVCERQWSAGSLPLTPQEAAVVLASIQPSAAAASSSGGVGDIVAGAVVAAVWAMQDCGPLGGRFEEPAPDILSPGVSHVVSSTSGSRSSSTNTGITTGTAVGLSAAQSSEPILSIESCAYKVAALSAVCVEVAAKSTAESSTPAAQCELACTLLANAAAAVSLQGLAGLPVVRTLTAAVAVLMHARHPAQQPAAPADADPQQHDTAASGPQMTSSSAQPSVGAVSADAPAGVCEQLLLCLSLAADLTMAVRRLDGKHLTNMQSMELRCSLGVANAACLELLLVLLSRMGAQGCTVDTATSIVCS
jgi:hypothetical protein